jgi:hypothetical protein
VQDRSNVKLLHVRLPKASGTLFVYVKRRATDMNSFRRVDKLRSKLTHLIVSLERQPDLVVHRRVNQFFYMQKLEELGELRNQAEEARRKLEVILTRLELSYAEVFRLWQQDARWLSLHLRCREPSSPVAAYREFKKN